MALSKVHAFTEKRNRVEDRLINKVVIGVKDKQIEADALWDTGATCTAVSDSVVKELGLVSYGKQQIKTPSGEKIVDQYLVNLALPNDVLVPNVVACGSEIGNQGIDLLIGMNIIKLGDFAVSNFCGRTQFTFRMPSSRDADYISSTTLLNNISKSHGKGKKKR